MSPLRRVQALNGKQPSVSIKTRIQSAYKAAAANASLGDVYRYAAPERRLLWTAIGATFVCGLTWPSFAIFFGRVFRAMTAATAANVNAAQLDDVRAANWLNSGAFVGIAIGSGLGTCISGFAIGKAGERIARRLRLQVFRVTRLHNCAPAVCRLFLEAAL